MINGKNDVFFQKPLHFARKCDYLAGCIVCIALLLEEENYFLSDSVVLYCRLVDSHSVNTQFHLIQFAPYQQSPFSRHLCVLAIENARLSELPKKKPEIRTSHRSIPLLHLAPCLPERNEGASASNPSTPSSQPHQPMAAAFESCCTVTGPAPPLGGGRRAISRMLQSDGPGRLIAFRSPEPLE